MSEKNEKSDVNPDSKKQSTFSSPYSDLPPPYSETQQNYGKDEKDPKRYENNNYGPSTNQNVNYDPMNDPSVYKVPPQLVNISRANPQHLNPSYQQYLEREQERNKHGDFPNPDKYKNGAPLNFNNVSSSSNERKTFPGKSGATYNNAANK